MTKLFTTLALFRRKAESTAATKVARRHPSSLSLSLNLSMSPPPLVRAFVETGDERCPLAGIWSRLTDVADCDPTADDPHLARPAMRRLLRWRAFHAPITSFA